MFEKIKAHKSVIIKISVALVVALFLIGVRLHNVPVVYDINVTLNGIQARIGDADYAEETTISFRGTYSRYRLGTRANVFRGRVEVEGYDFTFDNRLTVSFDVDSGGSTLYYQGFDHRPYGRTSILAEVLGRIWLEPCFSQVLITVYDPPLGWTSYDGLYISAPATNREEAAELAGRMTESAWSSVEIKW